jgi:hypothetical protein
MLLSTVVFSLLFSSFSVAAAPPLRRGPIHIPVLRRNYGDKGDVSRYARVAANLRRKYKFRSSLSRRGQSQERQDLDLTDLVRHVWYGPTSFHHT